jgi:hypothetical protein
MEQHSQQRITCEIEFADPRGVSELADVWLLRDDHVLTSWRNVVLQITKVGVEIFRQKPSFISTLIGTDKKDEIIATVYRNVVDDIIDKRNIGEK